MKETIIDQEKSPTNQMNEQKTTKKTAMEGEEIYYERFDTFSRVLHLMVIISFISLAFTGMVIKFSGVGVFQTISRIMGGYEVTGFIHRTAAIITFAYFFLHLGYLIRHKKIKKRTFKYMLSGENSVLPQKRDVIEFWHTIKWFLGIGPRPEYGRWTYWEKFDYFAVFWGVAIIGFSGLILWFPEFFTGLGLPGLFINVATIIHSDEALLATGFIFTIHFFNTHFRPDKFPMDTVMFTGRVPLDEFIEDRPRQYHYLKDNNRLESRLVGPPNKQFLRYARIFGFTALSLGILLVIMIIYSMIFLYQ
jgi:cytochrome b subunit of formate dehydrogenase